jgi:hypothetical protein
VVRAAISDDLAHRFPHPGGLFRGRWPCRSRVLLGIVGLQEQQGDAVRGRRTPAPARGCSSPEDVFDYLTDTTRELEWNAKTRRAGGPSAAGRWGRPACGRSCATPSTPIAQSARATTRGEDWFRPCCSKRARPQAMEHERKSCAWLSSHGSKPPTTADGSQRASASSPRSMRWLMQPEFVPPTSQLNWGQSPGCPESKDGRSPPDEVPRVEGQTTLGAPAVGTRLGGQGGLALASWGGCHDYDRSVIKGDTSRRHPRICKRRF